MLTVIRTANERIRLGKNPLELGFADEHAARL
jgi:hypothetical protein